MKAPKAVRNASIYSIVLVLQKGISFFLLPLYTMYLSPSDYGIMGVVSSVTSFLSVFITLGLDAAAQRFYYKKEGDVNFVKAVYGTIAIVIVINSLVWGGLFIGLKDFLIAPIVGDIEFFPYVFLGILTTIVTPLYLLFQNYLQTKQEGLQYGINVMCNFLLNVTLVVIFLAVFKMGVLGVLLAQLITAVVFFVYVLIRFIPKITMRFNKGITKEAFKYSLPLLPHTIANWSNGTLDRLLVNGLRTTADAGLYNLGQQYGSVMNLSAIAINQAYVPWFYQKAEQGENGIRDIVNIADIINNCLLFIALILSLFAKEVLDIMVSNPAYGEAWKIIPFIVFAYVFQGIYFFFVNVLFLKHTSVIFIITITSIAINIVANIILIPRYGYFGSALACLFTYFTKSIIALIISSIINKEIRFHWGRMYVKASAVFAIVLLINYSSKFITIPVFIVKLIFIAIVAVGLLICYKEKVKFLIQKLKTR